MDKMTQARCLLLARSPWYGHAAVAMDWIADDRTPTMGVRILRNGRCECRFNPRFVADCTLFESATVIQHEIEHVVRQHCQRFIGADPHLSNIACDMVINGHQSDPSIGIEDLQGVESCIPFRDSIAWLPEDWPTDLTAEQCYERLLEDRPERYRENAPAMLDDHAIWVGESDGSNDSDFASGHAALAAQRLIQAAAGSGQAMPANLSRSIEDLARPQVAWRRLLRHFVRKSGSRKRLSWSRRSRRIDLFGMPGRRSADRRRVSVVLDLSGSVTERILKAFFSELEAMLSEAEISVLCWDDHFLDYLDDYRPGDWKKWVHRGGGGTDMQAPIDWLYQEKRVEDCIVMLTDGYCNWPAPRSTPFLVVCSSESGKVTEPDWGKIVYLGNP